MPLSLNVKNDNEYTIEFCCGSKEYVLEPGQAIKIEVEDEDYMYFDAVR